MTTQTSSMGIMVCLITTLNEIKCVSESETSLRGQLISTVLMTAGITMVSFFALPSEFTFFNFGTDLFVKNRHASSPKNNLFSLLAELVYSSGYFCLIHKMICDCRHLFFCVQLACGLDLLLDTLQSIILAMLTGELSSSGY